MSALRNFLAEQLKQQGYDGLYLPEECACKLSDLIPCEEINVYCCPGYIEYVENDTNGYDFYIHSEKPDNYESPKTI